MGTSDNKYDEVLKVLKDSSPELKDIDRVTERVMKQIQDRKSYVNLPEVIINYLFGWVYIGWVRRSMVTAVWVVAISFVVQNVVIMKRVNDLSLQKIEGRNTSMTNLNDELLSKMLMYRVPGSKFSADKLPVSEKEIDDMIKSLNNLQLKYKDLIYLIEKDPQLKKYVEERMKEHDKN